jgi:hypothetical protein
MINESTVDGIILVRNPIASASNVEVGIGNPKNFVRVGFSGPCSKKYYPEEVKEAIRKAIQKVKLTLIQETEEILICGGGTKVGFLNQLYEVANELGLQSSAYLTAKVFNTQYEFHECDEVVYGLPSHPSIKPTWSDVSKIFIYDLDYHFALTTPNSGMAITLEEFEMAQNRMKEEDRFYSEMLKIHTWDQEE